MLLQHRFPYRPWHAASSGARRQIVSGRRLALVLVLIVTACLGTVTPCRAEGLVIEAPNLTGVLPGSTGSFDILLMNTNSTGGASFNVASDNLAVSISGPAGITITNVTTSTVATYIFEQSIDTNFGLPFASINSPPTSFSANDAGDVAAGYPGFQVVAPGQSYGLALVTYMVSSLAPPGAVGTISINSINAGTSLSDDQGNLLSFTPVNGSISLLSSSVPEPASIIPAATAVLIGIAAAWRHRRSSTARPSPRASSAR
jgi:hypothetical protein